MSYDEKTPEAWEKDGIRISYDRSGFQIRKVPVVSNPRGLLLYAEWPVSPEPLEGFALLAANTVLRNVPALHVSDALEFTSRAFEWARNERLIP